MADSEAEIKVAIKNDRLESLIFRRLASSRSSDSDVCKGFGLFVSLPTGRRKSFCYRALPRVFDCLRGKLGNNKNSLIIIVVSALMTTHVHPEMIIFSLTFHRAMTFEQESPDRILRS